MTIKLPDSVFRSMNVSCCRFTLTRPGELGKGVDTRGRVSLDGAEVEIHVEMSGLDVFASICSLPCVLGDKDDGSKKNNKKIAY